MQRFTDEDFPVLVGGGDLVGAAHLRVRHAADDEDDEARSAALVARTLVTVLVPVAVASGTAHYTKSRDQQGYVSIQVLTMNLGC